MRTPAPVGRVRTQACVQPLLRALEKAYTMSAGGAFVHHYAMYGLQMSDFRECFCVAEEMLAALSAL